MSEGIVGLAEEPICKEASISAERAGDRKPNSVRSLCAYLEDGLHLAELRPRMFASQHLDDQASHAPDVCFTCICRLFHNFGCHPENRALQ